MSKTQCVYPQVGCLIAAEEILGDNRAWRPVNKEQKKFLKEAFDACKGEVKDMSELESLASWECETINTFLKEKGFDIQLEEFTDGEFGAASVLDVLVKWLIEGEKAEEKTPEGKTFDAAKLPENTVKYYEAKGHTYPIAKLLTKEDDHFVYMTMLDKEPDQLDLVSIASKLQNSLKVNDGYANLIFPCVDIDQKVDIEWLKYMETTSKDGRDWYISQALQQTKLRMNEKGARAQSAVAIGVRVTSMPEPKQDYIINKPFLTWFDRPGLSTPLLVGYITEEDWKRPKDLETA